MHTEERRMRNIHGSMIWYELMTSNAAEAAAFYGAVLGWSMKELSETPVAYAEFQAGGVGVAGCLTLPKGEEGCATATATWVGYFGVDDVDANVEKVVASGGSVCMPPKDIPGVGRLAMLNDPQGVPFYVMCGEPDMRSEAYNQEKAGHVHWNELSIDDPARAIAFLEATFGWTRGEAMSMGELGDYQLMRHDGADVGAVMAVQPGGKASWVYYFGVEDIDRAATHVREHRGQVMYGPVEVPGGAFMIVAADPDGAVFGAVGPRPQV